MIKNMTHGSIYDDDFQWGEHIWFEVPLEGGTAALEHHDNYETYEFLSVVHEEDPTFEVSDIPAHPEGVSRDNIGDQWHWHDEDRKITFHAVYTHSLEEGYHPHYYMGEFEGQRIADQLDSWWEKNEAEVVWPMRLVRFGANRALNRFFDREYGTGAKVNVMLTPQVKTEAEFHIYWMD